MEVSPSLCIKNYLQANLKINDKILILVSCGLDSTVLFDLITQSKYLNEKNIYYLIFDHQKRPEGKFEIKQFLKFYNFQNKNFHIKKIFIKSKLNGFQEKSRSIRYNYLYNFSKKKKIKDVFIAHHLDDLNETFFMRKIQQSGIVGLSKIFSKNYKSLNIHRPLKKYSKRQIKKYAISRDLVWFEDRSNIELDFTRNKVRNFINSNKLFLKIKKERQIFSRTTFIQSLHQYFFKRKRDKTFEIENEKFNNLNESLKFIVVQSFYYEHKKLFQKQIRDENIRNFIKILKAHLVNSKDLSVFSGKIGVFKKKICINLT